MSNEEPSDFGCGCGFVVLGEAAASSEPSQGSLDDPSAGEKLEPFDAGRSFDNLDGPGTAMRDRIPQLLTPINPIGKNVVHRGERVSQPLQQRDRTMAILDVCRMNMNCEEKPVRIGHDMALAPVNALSRVVSAWPASMGRWRTLAVDDGRRGFSIAP